MIYICKRVELSMGKFLWIICISFLSTISGDTRIKIYIYIYIYIYILLYKIYDFYTYKIYNFYTYIILMSPTAQAY